MSMPVLAFVLCNNDNNIINWKLAEFEDWNMDSVEIEGNEKVLGHRKIDGAICKIILTKLGQVAAISKN